MTQKIKTPYEDTPYDMLSGPKLGPLSPEASRQEVDARFNELPKKDRATINAWKDLQSPRKRMGWDIFCSPLERERKALAELVEQQPTFDHAKINEPNISFGREFLVWSEVTSTDETPDFVFQEVSLSLSPRYDDRENPFKEVTFDV